MESENRSDSPQSLTGTKKNERRTIAVLLGLTAILVITILAVCYLVPYYGFSRIHPKLPEIMGVVTAGAACAVAGVLCVLIVVVLQGHEAPFLRILRSFAVKFMLPVLILVGRLVGLSREEVQHAFVAVNNELVMANCRGGNPPKKILLLMPHCLQDKDCAVKVTHNVENCKRCGKCGIAGLLGLSEKYGVTLAVATGGTLARRIVKKTRPDLIIAVACERDLTSGIQDTTPLPVYGIFNERPFGPCVNTRVPLDRVEAVLSEMASLKIDRS